MRGTFLLLLWISLCSIAVAQPSERYQAGTTWSPLQWSSSVGRMLGTGPVGDVQVGWTNALTASQSPRHAYWNFWDLGMQSFTAQSGVQINATSRAGYLTLGVDTEGFGYPAFHQLIGQGSPHTAVGIDFLPGAGAFTAIEIPHRSEQGNDLSISWPKIAVAPDRTLHVVSSEGSRIFYSRGTPVFDESGFGMDIAWEPAPGGGGFLPLDSVSRQSWDIACGNVAPLRTAIGYTKPTHFPGVADHELSNDVYLRISNDSGFTWQPPLNITQFAAPDVACYDDSDDGICCTRDTLRAFGDLSILFDDDGYIHVAFTTVRYYQWNYEGFPQPNANAAQIWHWSEATGEIGLVAEEWLPDVPYNLGPHRAMVHKPSLAQDSDSGDLYCSYLRYDTTQVSDAGMLNADIWIARSSNGGSHWSISNNVTQTLVIPEAPNGANASEQDPSLALRTSWGRLVLFYQFYRGNMYEGGELGSQSILYMQRVHTDLLPPNPLLPPRPFHAEIVDCSPHVAEHFLPIGLHELRTNYPAWDVVRIGDLDRDGDADLVATSYDGNLIVWWENVDGEFAQRLLSSQIATPNTLELADLDANGGLDVVTTSYQGGDLVAFCNDGAAQFTVCNLVDDLVHPLRVTCTDWLADGDLDIVCSLGDHAHILLLERLSGGDYNVADLLNHVSWQPQTISGLFDVDQRGLSEWLLVSPGEGFMSFQSSAIVPIAPVRRPFADHLGWISATATGDLDNDGRADVIAASSSRGRISWWRNRAADTSGNVTLDFHQITRNLPWVSDISVVDLNMDSYPDILACASEGYDAAWFANDGRGRFTRHDLDLGLDGWHSIRAADLDGDTDIDVIAAGSGGIRWIENGVRVHGQPAHPLTTETAVPLVNRLNLAPAFPNPFNSSTEIRFSLPEQTDIKLRVFDILGRERAVLIDGAQAAGAHGLRFAPVGLASGLYFLSLETAQRTLVNKLLYLK
ncbi:T9SS type A sorting domain-containing protein [candidate division KSB1 bacterium]|nr:T9SS type A sorting domain-containing protein [candidate division KSB1 bacterium]